MYNALDIRTLSLVSAVINLILCICMIYVRYNRKTYGGFTQWSIASILYSIGMVILSLRGILPDFITIVIANTSLTAGSGLIAYGIQVFVGSTKRKWLFIWLSFLIFVTFLVYTYYTPNVNARIVIISFVLALQSGYSGYIVYRYIPRLMNGQNFLLTTIFGIHAIWFLFRIIPTLFIEGPIVDFMKASAFQGASFVVFFGANMFVIIGLMILNSQRIEIDLLASMAEVKKLRGIIPICSSCKKIRNDEGIWNQIEEYIQEHSEAEFTHGICPDCIKKLYPTIPHKDGQQ